MLSSQSRVASSPRSRIIAATNARNEPFEGAMAMRPCHVGSVNPSTESGRSDGEIRVESYTTTRDRPLTPIHKPSRSENCAGTSSSRSPGSVRNRPASATAPREAGSWAKNTSAGLLVPSSRRVAARSVLEA